MIKTTANGITIYTQPVERQKLRLIGAQPVISDFQGGGLLNSPIFTADSIYSCYMASIILVEDDTALAETIETVLTKAGHNVECAIDSHELFTMLDHKLPELIISDVRLGIEDGKELCLQLKLNPKYKHIPVLLTTAFNLTDWEVDSFLADAYLPKPFEITDLEQSVDKLLRKYSRR